MSNNKNGKSKGNYGRGAAGKTVARKSAKPSRGAKPRSKAPSAPKKPVNLGWLIKALFVFGLIGLLFWQREAIDTLINQVFSGTAAVFGWGLLLVVMGLMIAVAIFKREALLEFARKTTFIYWYRWLGAIAFIVAVWGLLALFGAGGAVGLSIIGSDTGAGGVLRVAGLFLFAFVLIAPAPSWTAIKWFFNVISRRSALIDSGR